MYHTGSESTNVVRACWCCAHFSRSMRGVLSNTYHDRWIGSGGPTAWPPRSADLNPLDFYLWRHLKSFVYAAPVENEEASQHCTVDAYQTIRCYPGIFERMRRPWWDVSKHSLNLVEDFISTYCKCTLSVVTHKVNVSRRMLIWICFFFWYVELVLRICQHLSVTPYKYNVTYITYFIQVDTGSKFCLPLLGTENLHVPARYIRDFLCSMLALQVTIVLLLDILQLLILAVGTLKYLETKFHLLMIFIIVLLTYWNINLCNINVYCHV
jgi:hypothetical protein